MGNDAKIELIYHGFRKVWYNNYVSEIKKKDNCYRILGYYSIRL